LDPMRASCIVVRLGSAALLAAGLALPASAERVVVPPGEADVQGVLDRASDGDVVVLQAGTHRGPLKIARRIILEGEEGATVLGSGKGSVIFVEAADAVVRGLVVRGSGRDLPRMDAGVFIEKTAARAVVENNRIEGNLYGVYIHGAPEAVVRSNEIVGI